MFTSALSSIGEFSPLRSVAQKDQFDLSVDLASRCLRLSFRSRSGQNSLMVFAAAVEFPIISEIIKPGPA